MSSSKSRKTKRSRESDNGSTKQSRHSNQAPLNKRRLQVIAVSLTGLTIGATGFAVGFRASYEQQRVSPADPVPDVCLDHPTPAAIPAAQASTTIKFEVSGARANAQAVQPLPSDRDYIVRRGDCLWRIAHVHYGDANLWAELACYNGLSDPDDLPMGSRLKIPSRTKLLSEAAKTR